MNESKQVLRNCSVSIKGPDGIYVEASIGINDFPIRLVSFKSVVNLENDGDQTCSAY